MGALTDSRKRSFTDLRLPLTPLTPPPTKKPRLSPPPPFSSKTALSPTATSLHSPLHPPRSIHAPQRIVRFFGLGSSLSKKPRPSNAAEMGNLLSQFFQRKRDGKVSLEGYKSLVEERSFAIGDASANVGYVQPKLFSPAAADLRILTQGEDRLDSSFVLVRKVEDARMIDLGVSVKRPPLYKELYENTKRYDAELNALKFKVKQTELKVSGIRAESALKRELKPMVDLKEPFNPLTFEEREMVSCVLCGGNRREILVTHEPSNIEITREVLQCLRPGAWLNDEVINLYLELLKERERREPKKFLKCHFMNTFFYKKLTSGRNGYDFRAVKRWTTQRKLGYTLVECDKIFVPVHKDIHWCLAVINIKDKTFQYLDSLGGMDTHVLKILTRYLMDEAKDKGAKEINTTSWKKELAADLPLQMNGWDCGMFMLKYIDFYSRGLTLCFSQDHMVYFRNRTAKEILRLRAE